MKKLLAVLVCLFIAACGSGGGGGSSNSSQSANHDPALVGIWKSITTTGGTTATATLSLNADGTGTYLVNATNVTVTLYCKYDLRWATVGSQFGYQNSSYTGNGCSATGTSLDIQTTTYTVSGNTLVWGGNTYTKQ